MNLEKFSIQELLSLGYIYLLLLGIFTDTIYYSFFGLHIIAHSDILDILLSPISILTDDIIIPIVTILGILLMYFIRIKISPKMHEKNKTKESYLKKHDVKKLDAIFSRKPTLTEMAPAYALVIFCMFIGLRLGSGVKLRQRMITKDFSYSDVLTFQDNSTVNATIIGQNSLYIFCVIEDEDKLTTMPIAQNIKRITKRKK